MALQNSVNRYPSMRPSIYKTSTTGSANSNGTYVGGTGFTVTEDDSAAIASVNNSNFFTLSLDKLGDYRCEFQCTIARTSTDLLSTVRCGLRFDGVDYGFQQLNESGNTIILMRATVAQIFTVTTVGQLLRPVFNIVSQNSNSVEIRAADTELWLTHLG